jgi:hypothetical protein
MQVIAADRPDVPPFSMPDRFRTEVAYFAMAGEPGAPAGEYRIRLEDATRWLEELVFEVVSPLDAASKAEIELTPEQESWLEWMVQNKIEKIRLAS